MHAVSKRVIIDPQKLTAVVGDKYCDPDVRSSAADTVVPGSLLDFRIGDGSGVDVECPNVPELPPYHE